MRVSDDRYHRDRVRLDLAVRMMSHGARTRTVSAWTGLSGDRLRKLYRAYRLHSAAAAGSRPRRKMPRQATSFLQQPALGLEATTLSCLMHMLGIVPKDGRLEASTNSHSNLARAELFCEAYEAYTAFHSPARLSFEHAAFLMSALRKGEAVKLCACGQCGRLYLTDLTRLEQADCGCATRRLGLPPRGRAVVEISER